MNRRGVLSSILALGAAPAIVHAESLMRIKPIVFRGPDFLPCDGRVISRDAYPELVKAVAGSIVWFAAADPARKQLVIPEQRIYDGERWLAAEAVYKEQPPWFRDLLQLPPG